MDTKTINPTPKQWLALDCPCDIIVFGGARGGGKSACSYFKVMLHATQYGPNARILFLRKTLGELQPNIDEAREWWRGLGEWRELRKRFEFYNGAICEFNYLDDRKKIESYQGHAYTLVIYDELGNFSDLESFKIMLGNLRSSAGVPCQIFCTCNPGGPSHNIIKHLFIDPNPEGGTPIPFDASGIKDAAKPTLWQVYIPSRIIDNPYLLKNDPHYVERLKQIGSPEMVRAWLFGDWNIVSGGAFDKLWERDIHIVKPFRIPSSWRVVEVYDDGLSRPYCCTWFAISDGSDYYYRWQDANGERITTMHTIRGDAFVIAELYGFTGVPNEGTGESVKSKAARIIEKEKALGYHIDQRIADSAIFSSRTDQCIANEFSECGLNFEPCHKAPGSRVQSVNLFRNRLMASLERRDAPGIFWFSTCKNHIRTIPVLQRDKREPEDVDSSQEDHALDTVLYFLTTGVGTSAQVFDFAF